MAALSKQRMDYIEKPDGSVDAVMTITFPGGIVKRFTANVHPDEADAVSGEIVGAELLYLGPEVSGLSIFKRVGRLAKKVAASKVFALASKGLMAIGPFVPGIGPALAATGAGLAVASKLAKAGIAAAHGAKNVAAALTRSAAADAKRITKTPAGAAALLADANQKRLGVEAIADGKKPLAARPAPARAAPASSPRLVKPALAPEARRVVQAPAPAPARAASAPASAPQSDLLALARAGRVRSNAGVPVSPAQLLAAHSEGRIFWVA